MTINTVFPLIVNAIYGSIVLNYLASRFAMKKPRVVWGSVVAMAIANIWFAIGKSGVDGAIGYFALECAVTVIAYGARNFLSREIA